MMTHWAARKNSEGSPTSFGKVLILDHDRCKANFERSYNYFQCFSLCTLPLCPYASNTSTCTPGPANLTTYLGFESSSS